MASVEKRGDTWRVRVTRKGFRRESASFLRKADALAWASRRETEISAGRHGQIIPHTVKDALEEYRDRVAPLHRGARWEQVRLDKFARDLPFRHRLLAEVTTGDIASWRDSALLTLKPASVRREMGLLRLVFEACRREWRWLLVNPMDGVKRPLPGPARTRVFSDAEVAAIVARLSATEGGARVAAALRFALETALRAGELCSLVWPAVNAPGAFLTLPQTKNGDARDVPLSKAALAILADLTPGGKPVGSVFGLSTGTLDVLFRRARDAEGIEGLHFHDARATAITRLASKLDILELARMVGHRDLKSLQVYYRMPASEIAKRLD